jgi:hypothetical protein
MNIVEIIPLGFVIAALVVLVIPGPGGLYIVARSISHGYRGRPDLGRWAHCGCLGSCCRCRTFRDTACVGDSLQYRQSTGRWLLNLPGN